MVSFEKKTLKISSSSSSSSNICRKEMTGKHRNALGMKSSNSFSDLSSAKPIQIIKTQLFFFSSTLKKSGAKLILLQSSLHKLQQKQAAYHRLWLLAFLSFFTFSLLAALLIRETNQNYNSLQTNPSYSDHHQRFSPPTKAIPNEAVNTIIHYYSTGNETELMSEKAVKIIAKTLAQTSPANFLVFGLGHDALMWTVLNHGGRTVFIDQYEYLISQMEQKLPNLEAYDVPFNTKVSEMGNLLTMVSLRSKYECRPVQNLLFSDCKLGINDLPNHLYYVDWDVILVDGPRGDYPAAPGRMMTIFTAGVLARSKKEMKPTHVFVHDYFRRVERVYSDKFLCMSNLAYADDVLAHFVIPTMDPHTVDFCPKINFHHHHQEKHHHHHHRH